MPTKPIKVSWKYQPGLWKEEILKTVAKRITSLLMNCWILSAGAAVLKLKGKMSLILDQLALYITVSVLEFAGIRRMRGFILEH